MKNIIKKNKLTHIVCDVFANDTTIPDPEWIARHILKRVKSGSIILIHKPEKGVREWNYKTKELKQKQLLGVRRIIS